MVIEKNELLILSAIPGVGSARLRALVEHFGGTQDIFRSSGRDLLAVREIDRRTASSILNFFRNELDRARLDARRELRTLGRVNGELVSFWDDEYPEHLKMIYHPPPFLFKRSTTRWSDSRTLAVVGTRQPTPYGADLAERFTRDLVLSGFTIVSGLARGIDTIVHRTALRAGGRTAAVIGSGIDVIYPPENMRLASEIVRFGALFSELPCGAQPDAVNFPRRNRIISGMSLGTLVIETGVSGGAMITASLALEQNREVFGLPMPLRQSGKNGTNVLIKEGRAKLTENVDDILAELNPGDGHPPTAPPAAPQVALNLFEQKILDSLGPEPVHLDRIATATGLPTAAVLVELLSLELKGLVRPLPGKWFQKP